VTSRVETLAARPHQRLALSNHLTKSVADRAPLAVIVGAFLGLMGLVLGPMYGSIKDSLAAFIELMPPELVAMVGGVDMTTPSGWISGEMFSIMAPAAIILVAITSGAKAFAGEMEAGSIGLLVANPISRTRVGVEKALAMLVHVAISSLLLALGVWLGIVLGGLAIPAGNLLAITLGCALLATTAGGLAMLIAVFTGRRLVGLLGAAGVALLAYLVAWLLPLADALEPLAVLSPWHHYNGSDPLANGFEPVSMAILAGLAMLLLWASIRRFQGRDLPG
jgi:ABC-2 type transport system permease protein